LVGGPPKGLNEQPIPALAVSENLMLIPNIIVTNYATEKVYDTCSGTWNATYSAAVPSVTNSVVADGLEVISKFKTPLPVPRVNWGNIKKSGFIRMTDYDNVLVTREDSVGSINRNSYYYLKMCTRNQPANSPCTRSLYTVDLSSSWIQQGDLQYWRSIFPTAPHYKDSFVDSSADIEQALTSAYAELFSQYDLATEVAELSKTIATMADILRAVRHPLESFLEIRKKIQASNLSIVERNRLISSKWLEYQYGIMPLIYSAKDLIELLKKHDKFLTVRRRITSPISSGLPSTVPDIYFHDQINGEILSRITCKGHWKGRHPSLDRVSLNLFKTTWELIPYSFVVDWFINVGDYITAILSGLVSAAEADGCVSVRENYQVTSTLHWKIDERQIFARNVNTGSPPSNCGTINYSIMKGSVRSGVLSLSVTRTNSYRRRRRTPSSVELTFLPSLNWKRYLTSVALLIEEASQALRRLS
ncbi:maturation protein, partial [ssRNA phage SRR7976325_5]